MGGLVPLGYDTVDRRLVINKSEAEIVRKIFALYLEHGSARVVHQVAAERGYRTKLRQTESGKALGGCPFSRGHIYKLLKNPIYAGKIAHAGELYDGIHPAIIDRKTWDRVQRRLAAKAHRTKSRPKAAVPGLLVGLLHNADGRRLTHSHSTSNTKRYRYYIDQPQTGNPGGGTAGAFRIPARQIERPVQQALIRLLTSPADLLSALDLENESAAEMTQGFAAAAETARTLEKTSPATWVHHLQTLARHIIIGRRYILLQLNRVALREIAGFPTSRPGACDTYELRISAAIIGKKGQQKIVIPPSDLRDTNIDEKLVRSIARALMWFEWLKLGKRTSIKDIAAQDGLSESYVMRYIRLAFLAPDIIEVILAGRQPVGTSVRRLTNGKQLPISWTEQRRQVGLPSA